MDDDKKIYRCKECDMTISIDKRDDIPVCCGHRMDPELPRCKGVHPEMARNTDIDETCDDGRGNALKKD